MNERIDISGEIEGEPFRAVVKARNQRSEVWLDSCTPESLYWPVKLRLERGMIDLSVST